MHRGGPLPPVPDAGSQPGARSRTGVRTRVGVGPGHPAPGTGHTGLGTGIEHDAQARARARARRSTRARASAFALRISHRSRFAPAHARGRGATFPSATACTRRRPSPRRARRYRFSNATGTAWRKRAHRGHRINRPGPIRPAPSCCIGNDEVAKTCPSAQRTTVRSIDSIKSLPQPHTDEKATLGDERDAATPGTPTPHATPPTPADHTPVHPPSLPARTTRRPHGASAGGLAWGRVWNDAAPVIGMLRGCSLMVEHELPKLRARVRFSSPAPRLRPRSSTRALFVARAPARR